MASYNFFYNPTAAGGGVLPQGQPPRLVGGVARGPCSVPGCRNGNLDLLPRNKCQNCQAQLHFECTPNRDENGNLWCPYDCTLNQNNINNNAQAQQQLQLLQLQQQHHQQQQQQAVAQQQQQQQPQQQLQPNYQQQLNQLQAQQQQQVAQQQQQQVQQQVAQQLHPALQQQQQQQHHQTQQQQQQQQQQQTQQQQLQQQLQQHQQQLQQQAQQLQQLTAVAAVPPMPTDLGVDTTGATAENTVDAELAGAFLRHKRNLESGVEEDDDEDDEDLPPPPPRKRKKDGDSKAGDDDDEGDDKEDKKLSRRQQPPKTNITRTRYSNAFKMRVVSELQEPGYGSLSDISKHYGVAEQTLRDWMKNKDKIFEVVQRRGNMKANPVDHLKHVTQALLKFMDDHYTTSPDQPITARMIAQKGNEIRNAILAEDAARPYLTDGERKMTTRFSASLSWGKKWVRQYARPKTTQVPQDLEGLSKEELVRLLRSVASEREALVEQNIVPQNENPTGETNGDDVNPTQAMALARPNTVKPSHLLPYIPSPPRVKMNTIYKVDQAKVRIAENLATLIKKKAHNWKGRPTTELTEEIPTLEAARELMQGYSEVNKTARSYRWQLTGDQIVEWLNCPKYVHPVKFEGKVVCTIGQPAYVYAFAGYDSLLAKYEQGSATMTLKVKTFTAGTGNIPGCDEPVFLCNETSYGKG